MEYVKNTVSYEFNADANAIYATTTAKNTRQKHNVFKENFCKMLFHDLLVFVIDVPDKITHYYNARPRTAGSRL